MANSRELTANAACTQQMEQEHLDPNILKGHVGIKETFCLSNEFASNRLIFIKVVAIVHLGCREQ